VSRGRRAPERPTKHPDPLAELVETYPFPDPHTASPDGLLAYGGDLAAERLISAYAQGVFPWYESDPILWYSPDPRTVLLPGDLIVNRTLRKNLRRARFEIRLDTDFRGVIEACACAPRPGQAGTWITSDMLEAYCHLHELGVAHSCEAWQAGELVGGIYGISLGRTFFGESMFARRSDASKIAFVHLVRQLDDWGFHFLDCQAYTAHTERLGAREWPRELFLDALRSALRYETRVGRWSLEIDTPIGTGAAFGTSGAGSE
jgi:leucyl/phenylalanyl-tRNA--protein transferase